MILYVIGKGGHARVIAEAARLRDYDVRFVVPESAGDPDALSEDDFFSHESGRGRDWQ